MYGLNIVISLIVQSMIVITVGQFEPASTLTLPVMRQQHNSCDLFLSHLWL